MLHPFKQAFSSISHVEADTVWGRIPQMTFVSISTANQNFESDNSASFQTICKPCTCLVTSDQQINFVDLKMSCWHEYSWQEKI